ncbi:hypothetical protein [Nonomuraea basaltis]|uniref:hypothetical protein n=1 Tax=Nonomuraea basaltis TaxID=2495887 RepID=UPI00110C4EC5|nr:hypothetical protein [Nonomuraea basaltis]TMR99487.1 hypothetical protein EJK15_06645 [Nonomuraea basaltis]
MSAWLMSEDRLHLVLIDDIASVGLVVPGEPDPRKHPTKRLARAREVQLMVGSRAGVMMCAATCPGDDALWARADLMHILSILKRTASDDENLYVFAPVSWPRKRPEQLWQVSPRMPEPELIQH